MTAWSTLLIQLTDHPRDGRVMRDRKAVVTVLGVPWWVSGFQKLPLLGCGKDSFP